MTVEKILQKAAKKIYHLRHPSILSLLVRAAFKEIINSRFGTKILHFSAKRNLYNLFLFLVKYDANVDAVNKKGIQYYTLPLNMNPQQ